MVRWSDLTEPERETFRRVYSSGCGPDRWKGKWVNKMLNGIWLESCHEHDFDSWRGGSLLDCYRDAERFYQRNRRLGGGFFYRAFNGVARAVLHVFAPFHYNLFRPKSLFEVKMLLRSKSG